MSNNIYLSTFLSRPVCLFVRPSIRPVSIFTRYDLTKLGTSWPTRYDLTYGVTRQRSGMKATAELPSRAEKAEPAILFSFICSNQFKIHISFNLILPYM